MEEQVVATFEQLRTKKLKSFDELRKKPEPLDYGRIALPRERLPGVWNYDKQLDQLLGDPEIDIEDLMPLDVRYDFGRIVGMTEKPDETKDKMATSLFYSVELGIPPSVSFSILDELNKIAFDKSIPISNAWGRIKQRYRTGKAEVQLMDMGFDILKGTWQDWEKYDRSVKNIEKLQSGMTIDQRKEFRNFFEKLVGASAELAPFGLEAAKEMPLGAGIGGTLFGIGAAIIAGISPTIGEEALIPSAVFVGMKLGAGVRGAIRVGQLEAGGMFLELANMKDQYGNRIDPRIAVVASHSVGAINGAIEMGEILLFLSTLGIGKKLFEKSVRKVTHRLFTEGTIKEIIARKGLDYSIALSGETLQEIEQETTNVVFGWLTIELNNYLKGTDFKPITAEDLKTRYREVTVESMRAFGLMVLPGTTVSGALELVAQKKAEIAKKVEKPGVVEVKVEIPPEIADMTDNELYEKLRAIKITSPDFKPLYEEVVRRKEAKVPPTEAIPAPEKPVVGQKVAKAVEIPPIAAEAKPEAIGVAPKLELEQLPEEDIKLIEQASRSPYTYFSDGTHYTRQKPSYRQLEGKWYRVGNAWSPKQAKQLDEYHKRVAKPPTVAKAEPTKVEKKEALGLTTEEQKEYKRLKEIETLMEKEGLGAIAKESADRKRIVELEEKMSLAKAAEPEKTKLQQQIGAAVAKKGLTKKALEDLKKKHTGYRHLTGKISKAKITTEQLQNLLKAVQKARPKQVGYKTVITQKTEKRIQTLRKNLTALDQMSEKSYQEILQKETSGKEPTYIDAKNFVTQTQGQAVIKRMLDEAEIQRVVLPQKNAINKNKSISEAYEKIKRTGEIKDPCRLRSMRFYAQRLAYKAGAPIYELYKSIVDTNNKLEQARVKIKQHLMEMNGYDNIVKSEDAMQRISDEIASKSYLKDKPAPPTDITQQEEEIASYIENTLKKWRWKARVAKFFDVEGRYTEIPQYEVPHHREGIKKTVEILETKGTDSAIEYMKTQTWGVIRSGYEPLENITLRIRAFVMPAKAMAKGHIKPRTQIEYMRQERNIFQRFDSYLRQIDNLSVLKPKINAFTRIIEDNLDNFDNPQDVRASIEVFLLNLKHINPSGNGLIEKVIKRLYGQALTVRVLGDPLKVVRNYPTQNLVFEQDKSTLFDPRNKPLMAEDMEYFRTNIEQSNPLMREWAFAGEKPLPIPIVKQLTQFIRKWTLYPWSDTKNRLMSDTAKINQVRRAVEEAGKDIDKMMELAKFSDYEVAEQQMALGILALEGSNSMSRYIARCHVENTHYLYDTKQRSPAEQTVTGRLVLNLFLFRRASLEKLFRNMTKVTEKTATSEQRLRATKVVSVLLVSSFVMGLIWKRLTGQRRTPYDYIGFMELQPGGLAWGTVESFAESYNNLLNAARGDAKALELLATSLPRCSDLLLPFYKQSLDAIEATIGAKNLDRKAIRKLRELIDKEYKIRGGAYKVEREWYEAIQYAIAGAGVDVKEEKKVAKPKKIER